MFVNMDCPMDGRENMFVYGSGFCVPYPWQKVSISMLAGDLWILRSYVIHRGWAIPGDALPGSTRIIAFAAVATLRVDYEMTVLIIPPPWAEAPTQQPSCPKAVYYTAAQCNPVVKADPPPKYFACDSRPLCAVHVGQLCADCEHVSRQDAPAVEDAPAEMAAERGEEVDEGTQKMVEEDLCRVGGFGALGTR